MDRFPIKLRKILQARINPSSLQFRLTWEIILLLILGIGGLALAIGWEPQKLLNAFNRDGRLLAVIQHLKTMSILSIAVIATLAAQRDFFKII